MVLEEAKAHNKAGSEAALLQTTSNEFSRMKHSPGFSFNVRQMLLLCFHVHAKNNLTFGQGNTSIKRRVSKPEMKHCLLNESREKRNDTV